MTNIEAKELILHDRSVSIKLDANSKIKKGIIVTGEYAEFHGDGFKKTDVTISPKKAGAIIDFKGTEISKVTIEGKNVAELRGVENIKKIKYKKGADPDKIVITDSNGKPIGSVITPEKKEDYGNVKTGKLTIHDKSIAVTLGAKADVKNGVVFTGEYAEFYGDGFKNNTLTINPKKAGAIIDFKGTEMLKVTIEGKNVAELRGTENVQEFDYKKGADPDKIKFPSTPENQAPVVTKSFANQHVIEGETIELTLSDYFSDPDGDVLTFSSTKGTVNQETTKLTLQLEVGSHIVAVTATDGTASITETFGVTVEEAEVEVPGDDYYSDAIGKKGDVLKAALHEIIDDHHELSYSEVWDALKITDEDPTNSDNVILLYSGDSRSKNRNGGMVGDWNREHTWAKSHGNFGTSKGPGTDIHHLRPSDVQVNSSRGNLDFDYGGTANVKNCAECKRDSDSWEPPNDVKGDVARMLFYMAVRYEEGDKVDLELNDRVNNGSNPYHGKLSVLLEWHEQDPVSEWELNRNEKIEEIQGNRNPFIDNPEWANDIWGEGA